MSFVNLIKERDNIWDDMVEEIRRLNLKVIIYGSGNSGVQILNKLEKQVPVKAFAVSHEFYEEGKKQGNYEILDASLLFREKEEMALIFSICPDKRLYSRMEAVDTIKKVYGYDGQQLLFAPLTYDYVKEHDEVLSRFYERLSDEFSRRLMIQYINCRISGKLSYMEGLKTDGLYFNRDMLEFGRDEVFVDCGAFTGDTIKKFHDFTGGHYKKIVAFEPNNKNFEVLSEGTAGIPNVRLIKKGVWDKRETLTFDCERGSMSNISESGKLSIEVDRMDPYLLDGEVSFIKMNIEGSELKALAGAEETIKRDKPKMAVSVYHRPEDLVEIPALIHSYQEDYTFGLRIHSFGSGLLVLYVRGGD